jgi:acyl carrier protein
VNTTDADVRARVTEIIRDRLNAEVPSAETDLIESGLLDSLALVILIAALEEVFACELLLDDFVSSGSGTSSGSPPTCRLAGS